jgi:hypothetical protein
VIGVSDGGWRSVHLSEIDPMPGPAEGLKGWLPLRHELGVTAFGVNAWIGREAGDEVIEEHHELNEDPAENHEEVYVVIAGRATFTVDGNEFDAPPGTVVFVQDPALVRHAVAAEAGTTILAIGATPGTVFTPSPWEQRRIETGEV